MPPKEDFNHEMCGNRAKSGDIEFTPAMIEAGVEELRGFFPDSADNTEYDRKAVEAVFRAVMLAASEPSKAAPLPSS
jgi:hypothetical protein